MIIYFFFCLFIKFFFFKFSFFFFFFFLFFSFFSFFFFFFFFSFFFFFFFQAEDGIRDGGRDWSSDVRSSDLVPLILLAGQVRTDIIADYAKVRQVGPQEGNVVAMAKPVTKYAVTIKDPRRVRYEMERA